MSNLCLTSSVHNHSNLCDGQSSLQEMAVAAWKQGVTTLGFTGHSHTPCDLEYCMSPSRTARYKGEINRLKAQYAGKMDVLCGIEWDQFSDEDPTGYDYWIGSVHYLRGPVTSKYYEIDWRESDLHTCVDVEFGGDGLAMAEAYFASVAQVAEKKPTILGHFDLIKKLNGKGEFFNESSPRYREAALNALRQAIKHCTVLEINTGGVARGFRNEFYPAPFLLEEWRKLGGKVIITADAHSTDSILWGYEEAMRTAKAAGFDSVAVLTKDGFVDQPL